MRLIRTKNLTCLTPASVMSQCFSFLNISNSFFALGSCAGCTTLCSLGGNFYFGQSL